MLWPKDTPGMVKRFVKEAVRCARASHGSEAGSSEEEEDTQAASGMLLTNCVPLLPDLPT